VSTAAFPKAGLALHNNLLVALKPTDFALLQPHLRALRLNKDEVLYEPGDEVHHVYFPLDPTLIAFRVVLEDGRAVETALVGREGAICGVVSQGRLPAYSRSVVLHEGPALRVGVEQLEAAKLKSLTIRHLFARYSDCVMAQVFQSVACNATHSVEQRAAKWLVAATERISDSRVPLTQEQFAVMLGVGRSYVSRVVGSFREKKLIGGERGAIVILDIDGLRATACQCQDSVRRHFDEVLKGVYPDSMVDEAS
jgi:Crp-like helix-turn-helix domain